MEEEDIEVEHVFVAHEIDLDYEFDAARFFDFCRPETPAEAREAESWFETAGSYPPSPFVAKLLVREGNFLYKVNPCQESDHLEYTRTVDDRNSQVPTGKEYPETFINNIGLKETSERISSSLPGGVLQNATRQRVQLTTGYHTDTIIIHSRLTFCSKTTSDTSNFKAKTVVPKSSTLMKPTASQLAKQNPALQNVGFRFQKLTAQNNEQGLSISSGVEIQAAKRQKLEGGLLHKFADAKQQISFVHKAPKKDVTVEHNSRLVKLKLTIPREPDLETAHRAQRIRPKNGVEAEHGTAATQRFKARPLNRKILEAPLLPLPKRSTPQLPEFHEFHLKTTERAMQHISASSSSSYNVSDKGLDKHGAISAQESKIRDLRRPSTTSALKTGGLDFSHKFKAKALNKKDLNFHTEKRVQCNPPIELFSKLSLTSELQLSSGSELMLPQHTSSFRKDLKENLLSSFHPEKKEKASIFGGKQIQFGNQEHISKGHTLLSARRSLGVR